METKEVEHDEHGTIILHYDVEESWKGYCPTCGGVYRSGCPACMGEVILRKITDLDDNDIEVSAKEWDSYEQSLAEEEQEREE